MLWSFPVAVIAGTVVRLHATFVLFLIWVGATQYRLGGREAALEGVLFLILVFACVLAHEFGHIFAARRYGIRTPEVTLSPIGGVASLERIPERPREELVVALAGPAVNVVVAAALFVYLAGRGADGTTDAVQAAQIAEPQAGLAARLAAANVFLVLFNLIPAFPMDGGRVLRALLATRRPHAEATRIAARVGQGAAFLFALAGLFVNPMLIVIALFIYLAASAEAQHVALRDGTRELPVRAALESVLEGLSPNATLNDAVNLLLRSPQTVFPIIDGAGRPRGLLTKDALIPALRDGGPAAPVLDIMVRDVPAVNAMMPLDAALALLNQSRAPALFALDEEGRLIGLVTRENVGEMMLVRSVRPDWPFRGGAARPAVPA
ncbi:MAG TPA: site-2 protease family protein [Beijerinckiaceae bacterium]|jgi:stage IV sporulation protein FB